MDYEDVTVAARRGDRYFILVPTEYHELGADAPVFRAVIYDTEHESPHWDKMLSFDAMAKMGYWTTDDLPDAEVLLTESQLKRLADSAWGERIGDPILFEERVDVPEQTDDSLDWLHYDYTWNDETGRFVYRDGSPVDFSPSPRNNSRED